MGRFASTVPFLHPVSRALSACILFDCRGTPRPPPRHESPGCWLRSGAPRDGICPLGGLLRRRGSRAWHDPRRSGDSEGGGRPTTIDRRGIGRPTRKRRDVRSGDDWARLALAGPRRDPRRAGSGGGCGWPIVSCGSRAEANPWLKAYEEARSAWASERDGRHYRIDHQAWFAGSRSRVVDEIAVRHWHRVTITDLIGRALSKSNTSLEVPARPKASFWGRCEGSSRALRRRRPAGRGDCQRRYGDEVGRVGPRLTSTLTRYVKGWW